MKSNKKIILSEKPKKIVLVDQTKKTNKLQKNPDSFNLPIGWNFSLIAITNSISDDDFNNFKKYLKRLISFEGKSFSQIEQENDHSHSWPDTNSFSKEFKDLIKSKNLDEESIWQLHLGKQARLYGIRHNNIFKILLFDLEHKVYTVNKKHT